MTFSCSMILIDFQRPSLYRVKKTVLLNMPMMTKTSHTVSGGS